MPPKKTAIRIKKETAGSFTFGPHKILPGETLEVTAEQHKHLLANNADILEDAGEVHAPAADPKVEADADKAKAWKLKLAGLKKEELLKLAIEARMPEADKANVQALTDFLLPLVPKE